MVQREYERRAFDAGQGAFLCPIQMADDFLKRRLTTGLSHPPRPTITTFRTFLRITILAVGCTLSANSLLFAAELFPFAPPSPSQQRSVEQQPAARPQLSPEDLERISRIATQANQLNPPDRNQLKSGIQKSLNEAAAKGNPNQAKYFGELLRQID